MTNRAHLNIRGETVELHKPTVAHVSLSPRFGIDENSALGFGLTLDALFTNIVSHGYEDSEAHQIEVVARKEGF